MSTSVAGIAVTVNLVEDGLAKCVLGEAATTVPHRVEVACISSVPHKDDYWSRNTHRRAPGLSIVKPLHRKRIRMRLRVVAVKSSRRSNPKSSSPAIRN
jgi:hypothetical protein